MEREVVYGGYYYEDGFCDSAYSRFANSRYVDLDGKPIERTPITHPYNFDDYVEWKSGFTKGDSAVYSDRLYQWDSKKYDECYNEIFKKSGQYFNSNNPSGIEKFLSMYFGKEITLTAILRGCNQASGFPYWVFYYVEH